MFNSLASAFKVDAAAAALKIGNHTLASEKGFNLYDEGLEKHVSDAIQLGELAYSIKQVYPKLKERWKLLTGLRFFFCSYFCSKYLALAS